jgi:aminomethyltransferase
LLTAKQQGLKRKLVGLVSEEKAFPRHGYSIKNGQSIIGQVTSGTVSPILEKPIAMAYVENSKAAEGSTVNFLIRDKEVPATVVKFPFIKK